MKRIRSALPLTLLVFFAFTLTGCISVSQSVLMQGLPPVPMEDVTVYLADDEIPEHTRVAILSARGDHVLTTEGKMFDKLRAQAGKLGANALIVGEIEEPSTGAKVASVLLDTQANRRSQAIAILVETQ